jgi:hypothetical protein
MFKACQFVVATTSAQDMNSGACAQIPLPGSESWLNGAVNSSFQCAVVRAVVNVV